MILEGKENEVALIKMIYPNEAHNVYAGSFQIYSFRLGAMANLKIPRGAYTTGPDFVTAFQKTLGRADKTAYSLTFNRQTHYFKLTLNDPACTIRWSENLQDLTGFGSQTYQGQGEFQATSKFNPWNKMNSLYLYTSIVGQQNIGSNYVPLLSIIPFQEDPNSSVTEYSPRFPLFLNCSKRIVDRIDFEIKTETGISFPFQVGQTVVILLAFRPRL